VTRLENPGTVLRDTQPQIESAATKNASPRIIQRLAGNKFAREGLILAGFVALTAIMTWPWVTQLRNACADPGDPYLISWLLWWDFHQTFTSPLHLFDANIFFPLHQTLAFSENDFGIALLFFPLYALGLAPLTVNSIATFLGFAFSGYAAFRLTRTLTGSSGAAVISGIFFAFLPFRFHLMSQLHYVFAAWLPLTLEAFVLFTRQRTTGRAAWLAVAFTMNGLSCLSWFTLSLPPLALSLVYLGICHDAWRDRKFWRRGGIAAAASALALLPFMLPYLQVSRAYGFTWGPEVVARNSLGAVRWLVAEYRNRLWKGFGDNLPGNGAKLFPGLLAPLFAAAALLLPASNRDRFLDQQRSRKWIISLDAVAITAAISAVLSLGWSGSTAHRFLGKFFAGETLNRSLFVFAIALFIRLLIAYPSALQRMTAARNLIAHLRQSRRHEQWWQRALTIPASILIWSAVAAVVVAALSNWPAVSSVPVVADHFGAQRLDRLLLVLMLAVVVRFTFSYPDVLVRLTGAENLLAHIRASRANDWLWLGVIWTLTGFLMSLGMNAWFYRILYDLFFLFRSMREPSRGAMVANVGLAILAGVGARKLVYAFRQHAHWMRPAIGYAVLALALLFELRAAPMTLFRGAEAPDAITLRLKQTPMRGGLVELPTGNGILPHLYMLRSADHQKPLINAISTFVPPHAWEIDSLARTNPIPRKLLDAMERVPTSYLVIHNSLLEPDQLAALEAFLTAAVATDRLRFINRFDGGNDLYAVVKTEPEARSEAPLPFSLASHELSALIRQDPVNLLRSPKNLQTLYRVYFETNASLPRYADFIRDANAVTRGVILGSEDGDQVLNANLRELLDERVRRDFFVNSFGQLDDAQFVDKLLANAGINMDQATRAKLVDDLASHRETRAGVLLKVANDQTFIDKENDRSLLLLHYFAYLRRNPDDAPDRDLNGFKFWLSDLTQHHDTRKIATAFQNSREFYLIKERQQ
jgi:hypothetical protein